MCGFAGYCGYGDQKAFKAASILEDMSYVLLHRGPDGAGSWVSEKYAVALMHRRLAILDVTDAGLQPMEDVDKRIVLVFNGEIYNYRALKHELLSLGHQFKTVTDSEVIIYAYKQWGMACLNKLEGMFAFALFDQSINELFLVRDRIGIKPLYFSLQAGILSFASEIKALWVLPWVKKSYSYAGISHYLTHLATPAPMTMYDQIYKVPAGYYLRLDAHRMVTAHQWYRLCDTFLGYVPDLALHQEDYVTRVRALLSASVASHTQADVPVGIFLSGGIDSTALLAFTSRKVATVATFHIATQDQEMSESVWAFDVARYFGARHYDHVVTEKDAFCAFEQIAYHHDEPLPDPVCIPLYFVAQMAKSVGVCVVQVGEGADELFGGYDIYATYMRLQKYWAMQSYIPAFVRVGLYHAARSLRSGYNKQDIMRRWSQHKPLFQQSVSVFSPGWKDLLCDKQKETPIDQKIAQLFPDCLYTADTEATIDSYRAQLLDVYPAADFLQIVGYLEFMYRLPELLLMRVDKMTMAASVEARVPFLNRALVECALRLPMQLKHKDGVAKYILKKALENIVPHEVIYRKKVGFAAPTATWYKQGRYFMPYIQDIAHTSGNQFADFFDMRMVRKIVHNHITCNGNYGPQLWALHNLYTMMNS